MFQNVYCPEQPRVRIVYIINKKTLYMVLGNIYIMWNTSY